MLVTVAFQARGVKLARQPPTDAHAGSAL